MNKRVLIICYYWPPAGGPGVQRWVKFIKYLPNFGIEPVVLIPENPSYPFQDKTLINEISPDLSLFKLPIKEPYKLANIFGEKSKRLSSGIINPSNKQSLIERLLLFIRGNFFIPDARIMWVNSAYKKAKTLIENFNIDTVITTGPPHSIHLIGHKLKNNSKVSWISDFRDPWTAIGYHNKLKLLSFARARHRKLEALILNSSDKIIVTSPATKQEFQSKTNTPISIITNGYDHINDSSTIKSNDFLISHIGSLLTERNPKILWKVLESLVKNDSNFAKSLKIELYGVVSDQVKAFIKFHELDDYVSYKGYVSHKDSIKAQKASQLLLLIESNSDAASYIIPGKLFEYIASKTPIIAIGPNTSDIKKIIADTHSGDYFSYSDEEILTQTLKSYFKQFSDDTIISESHSFEKYSRYNLTHKLSELLK